MRDLPYAHVAPIISPRFLLNGVCLLSNTLYVCVQYKYIFFVEDSFHTVIRGQFEQVWSVFSTVLHPSSSTARHAATQASAMARVTDQVKSSGSPVNVSRRGGALCHTHTSATE